MPSTTSASARRRRLLTPPQSSHAPSSRALPSRTLSSRVRSHAPANAPPSSRVFDRRAIASLPPLSLSLRFILGTDARASLRFPKCAEEIGDCGLVEATTRGVAAVGVVRREQAVRQSAERAARAQRLGLEHVERRRRG